MRDAGATLGEVRAGSGLPDLPDDCRRVARSSVVDGDRLDVALLKTDAALVRQNRRIIDCADWYDSVRERLRTDVGPQ